MLSCKVVEGNWEGKEAMVKLINFNHKVIFNMLISKPSNSQYDACNLFFLQLVR